MDKVIKEEYRAYGEYINQWRSFPHILDGLKPIERRLLLSAFLVAKDKFVKARKINSHCTANFSPHGESQGTLVQLVNNGFIDGQGNYGSNIGIEPTDASADRYLEAKLSKFIENIAFKNIYSVPWEVTEWEEKEPLFLPTMLPFCLMGNNYSEGIGFAYKTTIPCFDIKDLYQRLLFLLKKIDKEPIIKPKTDCILLSSDEEIKELLTTGKAKLQVKGIAEYNDEKQEIYLKSWPNRRRFQVFLNKLHKELDNKDVGYIDLSSEQYGGTFIQFEILKKKNKEEIYKKVKNKIEELLIGNLIFDSILFDANIEKPRTISIDEMLLTTYDMYKKVSEISLNKEKEKLENILTEYSILLKIRPILSKYLKEDIKDSDYIIKKIFEETEIKIEIISGLFSKYNIKKLLTLDLDEEEIKNKINTIESNISSIDQFVLDQYKIFE